MYFNMKNEETRRMVNDDNIFSTIANKEKINKKRFKRKYEYYFHIFYIILIIFIILGIFTDIDNTKRLTRTASLTHSRFFLKNCTEGILMNSNIQSIIQNNPIKISVVIPVYNCQKTIKAAVRSIQNQNMAEIEIILVNDFSKDNSSFIIKEMKNEDPRIKLINNEKNMGALYSRNIGILSAKGKYVQTLDNDDMFMDSDVFDTIFDEAENGNYDIIGFGAIDGPSYDCLITQMYDDYFHNHKDGLIVKQPELKYFPIVKEGKYKVNDLHVWGRLVKTEIYQKAINNLGLTAIGENRQTCFLSWAEDSAMTIILFHFANSYKFIKKFGIFHWISWATASFTRPGDECFFGEIYFFDLMCDYVEKNEFGLKLLVDKAKDLRSNWFYNINNDKNKMFLKGVLSKIINSEYMKDNDRDELKKLFKDVL